MSTRANIQIINSKDDEALWFYRHNDGYPSGTLHSLITLMGHVVKQELRDNVSQTAGWLIIIGNMEYGLTGKLPTKEPMNGWKVGAYEPTTGRHEDIEYMYVCDLATKEITVWETYFSEAPDKKLGSASFTKSGKARITKKLKEMM